MAQGWDGILYDGEVILWQGRPMPGVRLEWKNAFLPAFFVFWTAFSVLWMALASLGGGLFWMFGLLFFGIGIYNLVFIHFWKAYQRSRTYYTLTDQRAFIAKDTLLGKTLDSYPIHARSNIRLVESGQTSDVYFATEELRGQNSVRTIDIGFERISDATEVLGLLNNIQRLDEGAV